MSCCFQKTFVCFHLKTTRIGPFTSLGPLRNTPEAATVGLLCGCAIVGIAAWFRNKCRMCFRRYSPKVHPVTKSQLLIRISGLGHWSKVRSQWVVSFSGAPSNPRALTSRVTSRRRASLRWSTGMLLVAAWRWSFLSKAHGTNHVLSVHRL